MKGRTPAVAAVLAAVLCGCGEPGGPVCEVPSADPEADLVYVPGGRFTMGDDRFYPEEMPPVEVEVEGFWISRFEVTNRQFARFVEATGYVTEAERGAAGGTGTLDLPGSAVFTPPAELDAGGSPVQWWRFVPGASWRSPEGPGSSLEGRWDHPVVHVSLADAEAYARWLGHTLPTEAQWEFAARGGLVRATYAWGESLQEDGRWMANTWQGVFPALNTKEDGHAGTAPVGCFPPNGYGLFDMIGNVWEWTSDPWRPRHDAEPAPDSGRGTIKGGSHLCARNYCLRYRPAARHAQEIGFSASHIGFRTVRPAKAGSP